MGLVLWIDKNTFATGLIEKVFKKKDLPFYALSSAEDFAYLVDDLRPAIVVIDASTALESIELFKSQYQQTHAFNGVPVIVIEDLPELEFVDKRAVLRRPFDPFKIPELIQKSLS